MKHIPGTPNISPVEKFAMIRTATPTISEDTERSNQLLDLRTSVLSLYQRAADSHDSGNEEEAEYLAMMAQSVASYARPSKKKPLNLEDSYKILLGNNTGEKAH